jgi:tRNA pseudouridine(38-40) synthase
MFEVHVLPHWSGRRDLLAIEIVGNSFMKNMVRIMAGTLVEVGRGRFAPQHKPRMLSADSDRTDAGQTPPPQGLTLIDIELARFDGPGDAFDRATAGEPPRRR